MAQQTSETMPDSAESQLLMQGLEAILSLSETANFVDIAKASKLNLATDFVDLDLSGVDLRNQDLRKINLSGSLNGVQIDGARFGHGEDVSNAIGKPASLDSDAGKEAESPKSEETGVSLTPSLESALERALADAGSRSHLYSTLEHLLLALTDELDAVEVMTACKVDIVLLKRELERYLDEELKSLESKKPMSEKVQPTAAFQRVVQRSILHVQSSGRDEVSGANVLLSIFSERESHATYFLQEQDMTRYDAVNFISHGTSKGEKLRANANRAPHWYSASASNGKDANTASFGGAYEVLLRQALLEIRDVPREHIVTVMQWLRQQADDDD